MLSIIFHFHFQCSILEYIDKIMIVNAIKLILKRGDLEESV